MIEGLNPKFSDGFADHGAGVAFYNNCGRFHCRQFELGDLLSDDFEQASQGYRAALFTIEDCALRFASRMPVRLNTANVLLLRDPLNNIASRLEGQRGRPEMFRVDESYIDLFDSYCSEYLGHTSYLSNKVTVSYNRFIEDRQYRDALAEQLGLVNVDVVAEVSDYGGGSSFSGLGSLSPAGSLLTRFRQHPLPGPLIEMLLDRPTIREACEVVFGFDLAERAGVR